MIIHGYTGGPYEVDPLREYLEEKTDWDLFVPTLPGHGEDLQLDGIGYEEWIAKAEKRLLHMTEKYEEIYLIGFSMGGMIASYLAAKIKIDKLVLLAPACKYITPNRWLLNAWELIKDYVRGDIDHNHLYQRYQRKAGMIPFKANIQFMKLVRYTRKYLKEVKTPVLIAHGQQDDVVPIRATKYVYEQIGSNEKVPILFSKSDHQICLGEEQAFVNQVVYDFLTN